MNVHAQVHSPPPVGVGVSVGKPPESDPLTLGPDSHIPIGLTSSPVGLRGRKNKPPNLELSPRTERLLRHNADHCTESGDVINDDSVTSQPPNLSVIMRSRVVESVEVGMNSPIVKRSSRLEQILEIPDVKAALVKDAGYEMMRRRSHDQSSKPCQDRQQTPGRRDDDDEQFLFDHSSGDSESASESDTFSLQSGRETPNIQPESNNSPGADKLRKYRAYMTESVEHLGRDANPYNRIADSTGPALLFGGSVGVRSSPTVPSTPPNKRKAVSKTSSEGDSDVTVTKSRALLSRFKFSSLSRSSSSSSMEGWESLARALARVGSTSTLMGQEMETFDLNPKLSPILKRSPHSQRWSDPPITQVKAMLIFAPMT